MKVRRAAIQPLTSAQVFFNPQTICSSCQLNLLRRRKASSAAALAEAPEADVDAHLPPAQATGPKQVYKVQAGVVLSRPPQITRDLHPFEKAYFLYQRRLNERLALPFTRYHYFTKKTPAFQEWQRKLKERQTPAHEIGVYNAFGEEGWNDELLVGAPESDIGTQVDALLQEAVVPKVGEQSETDVAKTAQAEKPARRITSADEAGDLKSLDRLLQRTLYLLVQNSEGRWTFPTASLAGVKENLHTAAERILIQAGGPDMNTWVVGKQPIGHYEYTHTNRIADEESGVQELGEKVFFMRARIMAGQANLTRNVLGLKDFRWLVSEEIETLVTRNYWSSIRKMLPQR